ncbi:cell division control protein 6 homolog [Lutzomyia longipalpis]|uniref:cell division control protein 6 homolog n=1 Tax=Lutzomyia longipalpis TaxID=7200 RepID=UPI002483DCD5|nr:cell division control protein 6 homolog [Lutzomyia longipalpis]
MPQTRSRKTKVVQDEEDVSGNNGNLRRQSSRLRENEKLAKKTTRTSSRRRKAISSDDEDSGVRDTSSRESIEHTTPPKVGKFNRNHVSVETPKRLLENISLGDTEEDEDPPEETCVSSYQKARQMLNSSATNNLPGREKEINELTGILQEARKDRKSVSLYISGPPGTGKTASLTKILSDPEMSKAFKKIYVNCTSIASIGAVYKKISAELGAKGAPRSEKDSLQAIEDALVRMKDKMLLLVLDEIDQLVGNKQAVLYTIYEWPRKFSKQLILVGIANSLDLTDRLLTRLQSRCELQPRLMHFPAYTKVQISQILTQRLEEGGVSGLFPPATLQLLAGKVAAISGDVRRALDIGRRIVEVAERSHSAEKPLNLEDLGVDFLPPDTPIAPKQVLDVMNSVYGTSQTLNEDLDDVFPLQQKILICSILLILKKDKNRDITLGRLHEVYRRVCEKLTISAVDRSEFTGLCSLVETRGIVQIVRKKEAKLHRITLQWDEEDVTNALKDKQLIAEILTATSCLGKK